MAMLILIPCLCSCCSIHLKHLLSHLYLWKLNSFPKSHLKFYILQEVLPDAPKLNVISSLNPSGILFVALLLLLYYELIQVISVHASAI